MATLQVKGLTLQSENMHDNKDQDESQDYSDGAQRGVKNIEITKPIQHMSNADFIEDSTNAGDSIYVKEECEDNYEEDMTKENMFDSEMIAKEESFGQYLVIEKDAGPKKEQVLSCDICGKEGLKRKWEVVRHKLRAHDIIPTDYRTFRCTLDGCGKATMDRIELTNHMQKDHNVPIYLSLIHI